MTSIMNEFQQPIGPSLPEWSRRLLPKRVKLTGQYCCLEPLDAARHAVDLYAAYSHAGSGGDWTYMFAGPFESLESYRAHAEHAASTEDPLHFAVIDTRTQRAVGTLSLMRIDPAQGVIEVGHVAFSPLMRRTLLSTEAQFLLMRYIFDELGYRRYEWKCDSLNEPSRCAAARLGFQFEGIFRQAAVYKGRSRDTAWFSIIDQEWPALRAAFQHWLRPENHENGRQQIKSLGQLRDEALSSSQDHK